jgi:hypothetical protein
MGAGLRGRLFRTVRTAVVSPGRPRGRSGRAFADLCAGVSSPPWRPRLRISWPPSTRKRSGQARHPSPLRDTRTSQRRFVAYEITMKTTQSDSMPSSSDHSRKLGNGQSEVVRAQNSPSEETITSTSAVRLRSDLRTKAAVVATGSARNTGPKVRAPANDGSGDVPPRILSFRGSTRSLG